MEMKDINAPSATATNLDDLVDSAHEISEISNRKARRALAAKAKRRTSVSHAGLIQNF